jgi:hypothetical protein
VTKTGWTCGERKQRLLGEVLERISGHQKRKLDDINMSK